MQTGKALWLDHTEKIRVVCGERDTHITYARACQSKKSQRKMKHSNYAFLIGLRDRIIYVVMIPMTTVSFQYWTIKFCSIFSHMIQRAPKIVMQSKPKNLSQLRVGATAFARWAFSVRGASFTELSPTCGDCREQTCYLFHDHTSNIWNTASSLLHQLLQPVLIYRVPRFLTFFCPFKRQKICSSRERNKQTKNPPPLKSFSVNHRVFM